MCGIWGYVGANAIPVSAARTGLSCLTDRGPDDWGLYVDGSGKVTDEADVPGGDASVLLGNRRLAILDLSAAGNQPMVADGRYWIVYNGEVYNFRELREDLHDRGYTFESDSDTEVILRAYQAYGEDCVERFRGMFAFAVYDAERETLFAARDRFGIKPFYYSEANGGLAFASEFTSLLESGVVDRTLDPVSVDGFLALGYVPGSRTIVDGVTSLPPGTTLTYDRNSGETETETYWSPSFGGTAGGDRERVRDLLEESVRLRLRSDVPVGAFLSGGLDSSTIVALMRQVSEEGREDLHTFSVGFDHEAYSETDHAERVAEAFGTAHTARTVTASDVRAELDTIVGQMDQPTIDGVNTYFVSKAAADAGLKVALSGLGSDELFFGYPPFRQVPRWTAAARALYAIPGVLRRPVARGLSAVGVDGKISDAIAGSHPFGAAYVTARGLFHRGQRRALLDAEPHDWADEIGRTVASTLAEAEAADAVSHAELVWYMHNQLLRDTDVLSMAHSLEVRVPFLDGELADYVAGVDANRKAAGEKGLLKDAMADALPDAVLERDKSGFTFPFADWLDGALKDVVRDALSLAALEKSPLDPEACEAIHRGFHAGEVHWSRVWALVVLSRWVDQHITDG